MEEAPVNDELAGRVLDKLIDWSDEERSEWVKDLATMADYKYDHYEKFSAGERFFERLARWIKQFEDMDDRRRLVDFVRRELVFISRAEMNQAIGCVYPHKIRPLLTRRAAQKLGISEYMATTIAESSEFREIRRKTLFLGLSDGARLDQLRRSSTELSHEQFSLSTELGESARRDMLEKLHNALASHHSCSAATVFETVVMVDDFYGSGTSLIDKNSAGGWKGKLWRANEHLTHLSTLDTPVVRRDPDVLVVIYIASAKARDHIETVLSEFQPKWQLVVIQELPQSIRVDDSGLRRICGSFFDNSMVDEHKGPVPHGYKDAALPVVLFHNTPNNSVSPLWADTEFEPDSLNRVALFPRYERHHAERP